MELFLQMGCELFPVVVGMFFLRHLDTAYRFILLQVCTALFVECMGYAFRQKHQDATWLFNMSLLTDCAAPLGAAFHFYSKRKRVYFLAGYGIFLLCWLVTVFRYGIHHFSNIAFAADAFLLIVAYLLVFYKSAMSHHGSITRLPLFWLSIGIVLFYSCNLPYFSVFNYLAKVCSRSDNNTLFLVLIVLNNLRYIFTTVSIYLFATQAGAMKQRYNAI